jgi:hypothetical protein
VIESFGIQWGQKKNLRYFGVFVTAQIRVSGRHYGMSTMEELLESQSGDQTYTGRGDGLSCDSEIASSTGGFNP